MFGNLTIRAKTLISFIAVLAIACGLQGVLLWQFGTISGLNQYLAFSVIPGVSVSADLDDAISTVRIFDAQHLMTDDPAVRTATVSSLSRAKDAIAADLEKLRYPSDSEQERRILASLHEKLPEAFRINDEF